MTLAATRNIDLETALADAEAGYVAANETSKQLYEAACAVMPGGNTRSVLYYSPYPLTIVRGEGCRVWDADSHEYTDFLGEYTAGLYGHSHPAIMAALRRALANGIVLGGQNDMEGQLAAAVCARFPSIERVRFTNSGTEANLMAISTARAVTGRGKVMAMRGGYHGGLLYFRDGAAAVNAPFPYVIGDYNDVEGCRKLIREHGADLACVILEPMLGGGGCIPATQAFLDMLRAETELAGTLLIFDEVMTSRLGSGGLQAIVGVMPDMTTLGKYIGGGMSFGAFGGRADLLDRYDPRRPDAFPHAGTFNNNVLTMNAGYTGLSQVFTSDVVAPFNAQGDVLRDRLNALAQKHRLPVQFTGRGSMISTHFRDGEISSAADVEAGRNELRPLMHFDLLARGIYAPRRGMFVLTLPMTESDFDTLVATVDEFFASRASLLAG